MRKQIGWLAVLALALVLAGCGAAPAAEEETVFAVLNDDMGRRVVIPEVPLRIVSLSPSNTEILFALGLEGRIVGVTDYCNYPAEALATDKVGGFSDPNTEKVLALRPDLVVAGNIHEDPVTRLEELDVPVIVLNPQNMDELFRAIDLAGRATDRRQAAGELIEDMRRRLDLVHSRVSGLEEAQKVKVYYEVWADPLMSAGPNSLIHQVLTLAGGINIFADATGDYPQISGEAVVSKNPDVILFPSFGGMESATLDDFYSRPGWTGIAAIQDGRIYALEDTDKISRLGPRFSEAVEEMALLLYPELFD